MVCPFCNLDISQSRMKMHANSAPCRTTALRNRLKADGFEPLADLAGHGSTSSMASALHLSGVEVRTEETATRGDGFAGHQRKWLPTWAGAIIRAVLNDFNKATNSESDLDLMPLPEPPGKAVLSRAEQAAKRKRATARAKLLKKILARANTDLEFRKACDSVLRLGGKLADLVGEVTS